MPPFQLNNPQVRYAECRDRSTTYGKPVDNFLIGLTKSLGQLGLLYATVAGFSLAPNRSTVLDTIGASAGNISRSAPLIDDAFARPIPISLPPGSSSRSCSRATSRDG